VKFGKGMCEKYGKKTLFLRGRVHKCEKAVNKGAILNFFCKISFQKCANVL